MDPDIIQQLAKGAIPPGIIGALLLLPLWWSAGRRSAAESASKANLRSLLTVAVYAIAFVATFSYAIRPLSGSAVRMEDVLPWIALTLAFFAALAEIRSLHWPVRALFITGGAVLASAIYLCFAPTTRAGWTTDAWKWYVGLSFVTTVSSLSLAAIASSNRGDADNKAPTPFSSGRAGPVPAIIALIVAAFSSQLLVVGFHGLKFGQVAGIGASFAGAAAVVAVLRPKMQFGAGTAFAIAAFSTITLAAGIALGDAPDGTDYRIYQALLVALSPVAAAGVGLVVRKPGFVRGALQGAVAGLVALSGFAWAAVVALNAAKSADY